MEDQNKTENSCSEPTGHDLRKMRSLVFHILYALDSFDYDCSLESIVDNFNRGFDLSIEPDGEICKIVKQVLLHKDTIDQAIKPFLENWRFERIGCCTKVVLRYACWELLYFDTPANIVINEAIELAKCFSEKDAYKFVNGILDEIYKNLPEIKKGLEKSK